MRILVTAGPTREFLDPVRFLSNRSSGKSGYAIAAAAAARGHTVHLVTGPVALSPPPGIRTTPVVSAADMLDAVRGALVDADALIMCAAVADWRPRSCAPEKLKKSRMTGVLELERTEDILQAIRSLRRPDQVIVGFAAETERVLSAADGKRRDKDLDLVVANDVSRTDSGFEVDVNAVTLVTAAGSDSLPLMPKTAVAERILDRVEDLWMSRVGSGPDAP